MTTQQAYEMMRVYLTRPGAVRAVDSEIGYCAYEAVVDGVLQRCAVGCLLTPGTLSQEMDFTYEESSEGQNGIVQLREFQGNVEQLHKDGYVLPELDGVDEDFLLKAQVLHDNSNNWTDSGFNVDMLDVLAEKHDLTVVVDKPVGAHRKEVVIA